MRKRKISPEIEALIHRIFTESWRWDSDGSFCQANCAKSHTSKLVIHYGWLSGYYWFSGGGNAAPLNFRERSAIREAADQRRHRDSVEATSRTKMLALCSNEAANKISEEMKAI